MSYNVLSCLINMKHACLEKGGLYKRARSTQKNLEQRHCSLLDLGI